MRKLTYLAVLEPSKDGGYGVYFPDIPGCISFGKTIKEAQDMAEEAVGLHIYSMEQEDETLPLPSEKLDTEDISGWIIIPIDVFPDLIKNEMDFDTPHS
jgi:predicted RNase H-like HicB family nuclease